ncbi:MAG TPA: glycosyltransferase family 4 protein [Candidatus Saccharimonadales bacterium]|nr:glycosyltransferase family 4 protein [Candidatus Saccharimonadales bacterium]
MKIGLVCPYNIAKGGGVQEIVRAQQKLLLERGHDAYIITPLPREGVEPEDKMIFIGGSADFSALGTTGQVSAGVNETIDEVLEEYQFDILHFHEPWVPMISLQILSRSNTINVATFHAKLPETMMSRTISKVVTPYTKSVLKYIHELTAVSEAAADYVCSMTERSVAIVPNGIDLSFYKPPVRRSDNRKNKTIFFVGRLEPRKGVKYLVQAFHLLQQKQPDAQLVIAGDGPDRERLEDLVFDLELKNVEFVGYITNEEKRRYLQTADLFCAPALHGESFGIVLLEAMACGLVTVAGDNPGYASVMQGLGAVSLVNPKHAAEFARRLELLLTQGDLRAIWRAWAADDVMQYDWNRIIEQYELIYTEARKKHKPGQL